MGFLCRSQCLTIRLSRWEGVGWFSSWLCFMLILLYLTYCEEAYIFLSFYCLFKREILIKSRNWPFSPYVPWIELMQEKPRTHPVNLIWRRFAFSLENNKHHASQNFYTVDVSVGEVGTGLLGVTSTLFPGMTRSTCEAHAAFPRCAHQFWVGPIKASSVRT